jgi:carbamoyl-phosphate synthase large subunit
MKILFTGGGGAGNEAIWRLLGQRYDLHFADADPKRIDPSIPADRCHAFPWASESKFVEAVSALCQRLRVDVLIPAVDEELLSLSLARDDLAPTHLMLPSADYVAMMLDKLKMAMELSRLGIPVPATRTLADGLHGMSFPCIAKPRRGRGSRGVSMLKDQASARLLAAQLGPAAESMLLQERIEGAEYTVQMLADSGTRLHSIVPVKVLLKNGVTIRGATDPEPRVIAACRGIHDALPAAGCYNIQLMLSPDGRVLPFEINPRISTTFCLVVASGRDPIEIFFSRDWSASLLPFTGGVQLHRHWKNHFSISGEA